MGFASPSPTTVAEFPPKTLLASSNRSLPPREKTGLGLASGSLAELQIGLAAPSECAAEYILTMAALVFRVSFRTGRQLLFRKQARSKQARSSSSYSARVSRI